MELKEKGTSRDCFEIPDSILYTLSCIKTKKTFYLKYQLLIKGILYFDGTFINEIY
jgi:hypothetical protein